MGADTDWFSIQLRKVVWHAGSYAHCYLLDMKVLGGAWDAVDGRVEGSKGPPTWGSS